MTYQANRRQLLNGNSIKPQAAAYKLQVFCITLILAAGCANKANDLRQTDNFPKSAGANIANLPNKIIKDSKNGLEELSETSGYVLEAAMANTADWPSRTIENSKDTFLRTDNMMVLLVSGGASIAMHNSNADKNIAEHFEKHGVFHGFADESLNLIGHPITHLAATGLCYAISAQNQDKVNTDRSLTMITALSLTNLTTMGLKAVRDNEAPNGKDWSWPSGHTASSFTVASVLDEFYGPKVGVPAYAVASLVAYRMLDTGDHWASDVVFGASLGWVVGHTFASKHKQLKIAGFKVLPYTGNNSVMGLSLVKRF